MTGGQAKTDREIITYVRVLMLTIIGVSLVIIFTIFSQKSKQQNFTDLSIYHDAALHRIDVLSSETASIRQLLSDGAVDLDSVPTRNQIGASEYLIRQHIEQLQEIQDKNGEPDLQLVQAQLATRLMEFLALELSLKPLMEIEIDSVIANADAILLKLKQLGRLHSMTNSELLNQRNSEIVSNTRVYSIGLSVALLIGAFITFKSFKAIERVLLDRERAQGQLFREKERSQTTLESIGDAVITTDAHGLIAYLNPIAEELTHWKTQEALGLPLARVFNIIDEQTGCPCADIVSRVIRDGVTVALGNHTVLIDRDEGKRAIEDSAAPIRGRDGGIDGVVIVFHDVSKVRKMTRQMSWQASHDALTHLINRHRFEQLMRELIGSDADTDADAEHQHVFFYMDLDQFKVVNDTCGHVAGDELLKQISTVIKSNVREVDTLGRLGGDEFGVLLKSCPLEQAIRIANQIREAVGEFRFVWENSSFSVGVSIGLVSISESMHSVNDVMRCADVACYAAKDTGRNRVHVYEPDDAELKNRQGEMEWVSRIKDALLEDRFVLYCQKIVSLDSSSGGDEHFEILLRMIGKDGEEIPPMVFIPAAERYQLMSSIDRWVIRNSFKSLADLQDSKIGFLAVNISGQSLGDDDFMEYVVEQMEENGLAPEKVCFEITETAAITCFPQAIHFISVLKKKGCLFALDDFGSGLSSFSYLKNLPVNFLKIDGTFVRDLLNNPIDRAMVDSINSIGHTMNIQTIAEFVENTAIASELRCIGVDYGQGFGLSRPAPLTTILGP